MGVEGVKPSGSEPCTSSSVSAMSSPTSFCSSEGVGVEEALEVGVPGRLLVRLLHLRSRRRTWATAAILSTGPAAPASVVNPSRCSGPGPWFSSGAGEEEVLEFGLSKSPLVCSAF